MEHKAVEIEIENKIYYFNFLDYDQKEKFYRELMKLGKKHILTELSLP